MYDMKTNADKAMRTILVGTYSGDQLIDWPGMLNIQIFSHLPREMCNLLAFHV